MGSDHKRGITVVIRQKSDQIAPAREAGAKAGDLLGWTSKPARTQRCRMLLRPGQVVEGTGRPYDKLAITYRAAVVLSACITWTRT